VRGHSHRRRPRGVHPPSTGQALRPNQSTQLVQALSFTAHRARSKRVGQKGFCLSTEAERARWRARRTAERHKLDPSLSARLTTPRECNHCGVEFVPMPGAAQGPRRTKYCTAWCARRSELRVRRRLRKHRHRARRYGCEIERGLDPVVVFKRDGWRCQLCGKTTPMALRGTCDARAPELDHIVPMSRGGGHTWVNVQCACRACNIAKGSKPLGQQRLV
jgi:5-methylcytosine-specific restriction endonuclease McrA